MEYEKLSPGEREMKMILDKILPKEIFIDNFRPDWLKNPNTNRNLELDRYYPNLKIGFEYNGLQHRKKIDAEQWERDKIKKSLCAKAGVIKLVVYKRELTESIILEKINESIEMRECWKNGKVWAKKKNKIIINKNDNK